MWERVRTCCHRDSGDDLTGLCRNAFQHTEQYLRKELAAHYSGGTTATVTLIVDGTFIVCANVGDSPAVLGYDNNRPHEVLTASHSADAPEEYTRYRARCARDNIAPVEFVYNRFNCPGGHRLPGPDGTYEAIPIFTLDESGQAVPIARNSEYVASLGHHGGIQTVRKHVLHNAAGEVVGVQADMAHLNWGSTVAGRPQNTRVLGDFEDKAELHLDAEPSVSLRRIDRSAGTTWLVVASDGVADAHWFETMMSQTAARAEAGSDSAQALCEGIVVDTLKNAREARFAFDNDLPSWDDLSMTLVALPAISSPWCAPAAAVDQAMCMEYDDLSPMSKKQRTAPHSVTCVG